MTEPRDEVDPGVVDEDEPLSSARVDPTPSEGEGAPDAGAPAEAELPIEPEAVTADEAPPEAEAPAFGNSATRLESHHTAMTDRDANLILARAHLRLGALGLARAELETMAGRNDLDDDGIRDLAEARWRTGDTTGAGEAAAAYLAAVPEDVVALVIAAEAQAELGRPAEARRLAGMAMEGADGSLDPIFAGMRRSSIWPADPGTPVGPSGVLFDELHPSPVPPAAGRDRRANDRPAGSLDPGHAPLDPALPAEFADGPGLWDDQAGMALGADGGEVEPSELFHRARAALDEGETSAAGAGLLLALRGSPELAPAVIDLLSGRTDPMLLLVRADAYETVGRDVEAMRDRAAAAGGIRPAAGEAATDEPAERAEAADAEPAAEPDEVGDAEVDPSPPSDDVADPRPED
jgi:hypothetical protein